MGEDEDAAVVVGRRQMSHWQEIRRGGSSCKMDARASRGVDALSMVAPSLPVFRILFYLFNRLSEQCQVLDWDDSFG